MTQCPPTLEKPQQVTPPPVNAQETALAGIRASVASSARWFFWIAGLSLVNMLMIRGGEGGYFIVGLALPLVLSAIDHMGALSIAVNVIMAGVFVLLGIFGSRQKMWALILGIVIYALDGLLFLAAGDMMSIGFHALALYFLLRGVFTLRKANRLEATLARECTPQTPPNIYGQT